MSHSDELRGKVQKIVEGALRIVDKEARAQFIENACVGDRELQAAVESRLMEEERPTQPSDTVTMSRFLPAEIIGGRFRIIRFLGHGGMGDVYEADDTHLGGAVALKVIRRDVAASPRMLERFLQEIQLAKQVTHQNVCRIYDIGYHDGPEARTTFLTMELLLGETLSKRLRKGRMPLNEVLELVRQMAAGLGAAHEAGIIHRDFKSGNVMLVPAAGGGAVRVKITDFGLACSIDEPGETDGALTRTGEILGTPDYMAPEQVSSDAVGPPTDIYALGVVMFEMVTGQRPFVGGTQRILAAKLSQRAPSPQSYAPDLPRAWESAILSCLERNPADRFQAVEEILDTLIGGIPARTARRSANYRWLALSLFLIAILLYIGFWVAPYFIPRERLESIAILPFENSDAATEYLSDGVTDDLITTLGRAPNLRVMARSAVFRYKGKAPDLQELGRALKIHALLTGRIVRAGDDLSVNAELTDVQNGRHLWGQQYRRTVAEVSAIEEDISRDVLNTLHVQIGPDEKHRLRGYRTNNPEANEAYWKGRYFWNKRTKEGLKKGIEYFADAITKDPRYAVAYAGLADCYSMLSGLEPPKDVFSKATDAATKAVALNDTLAEAHASLAFIRLFYEKDWLQTEKEYRLAIQLNPNYATAHSMYALYLTVMKRFPQALAEMKRALELDPQSLGINTGVGRVLYYQRNYRQASEQYMKTLDMNPDFSEALFDLGKTLAEQRHYDDAIRQVQHGLKIVGNDDADATAEIGYVEGLAGRKNEAAAALQRVQALAAKRYVSPYCLAVADLGAGQKEAALSALERAYEDRSWAMIYLGVDPRFERLRTDPRYHQLLTRLGLQMF